MTPRTLVLGLGNILLRDEGAGVWVAESLRRQFEFLPEVAVLDGGTLGLDLLPRLHGVERLLVIDAVKLGRGAGSLARLEGEEVPAVLDVNVSPHQVGVQDLLAAARLTGSEPARLVLWGIEPERLDPGTAFSPPVAEALPELRDRVLQELELWGVPGQPIAGAVSLPIWWDTPGAGRPRCTS
jgi:hydrogenase maturation protease